MTDFRKAYPGEGKDIILEDDFGPKVIRRGGSKAWRNNNPGNIERGNFSKGKRSIGDDGRFAIFPDYSKGRQALEGLLKTNSYKDLSVEDAMKRYAPSHENDTDSYTKFLENEASVKRKQKIKELPENGLKAVVDAIERYEGNIAGETIPLPRRKPTYDATGRFIRD